MNRGRRAFSAAMGVLLVGAPLIEGTAGAIGSDTGWTANDNAGYGNGGNYSGSPDCYATTGYCIAWAPNLAVYAAEAADVPFHPSEETYSINRWNNGRVYAQQPLLVQRDDIGSLAPIYGQMSIYVRWPDCGRTSFSYTRTSPDGRNQGTITHIDILYRSAGPWVIGGFSGNQQCDMGIIKTHEFGHALGLGHTTWGVGSGHAPQLMYAAEENGYFTPQARDLCGYKRIYVQVSC